MKSRITKVEKKKVLKLYAKMEKHRAILKIKKVKQWKDNPNNDFSQVPRLAEIFKEFGQITPIVVWDEDMVAYKGNHTIEALKLLGAEEVEAEVVEFPDQETAELYGLADNESSNMTVLDDKATIKLLQSKRMKKRYADPEEIRMITGFSDKKFKSLILSSDMPDKLPDVSIEGFVAVKTNFLVVQFEEPEEVDEIRKLLGIQQERQRVVLYEQLKPFIDFDRKKKGKKIRHKLPF